MSRNEEFSKGTMEHPIGLVDNKTPDLVYTAIPIHHNVMEPVHVLSVGNDEGQIGRMTLHPDGRVDHVFVNPRDRRQGHATNLWNMGKYLSTQFENWPEPKHSHIQTPEGKKWAKAVGDE